MPKFRSIRRKKKATSEDCKDVLVSASKRKLSRMSSSSCTCSSVGTSSGQTVTYNFSGSRLVELHSLDELISSFCVCASCKVGALILQEYCSQKEGFYTVLSVHCENCGNEIKLEYSLACSLGKFLELNRKAVLGMCLLGQGRSALETFCAVLELPSPLVKLSYQAHVSAIHEATVAVARESMQQAVQEVRQHVYPEAGTNDLVIFVLVVTMWV